jgi:hypothetical protein
MSKSQADSFALLSLLALAVGACGGHAPPPPKVATTADVGLGPPVDPNAYRGHDCGRAGPCSSEAAIASAPTPAPAPVVPPTAAAAASAPQSAATVADVATLDPEQPMPKGSVSTNATLQLGQAASAMLDARSDIYSAGAATPEPKRGGVLPAIISLASAGGAIVFSNVRGQIGCIHGSFYGADGGGCVGGNTHINAAAAVSGIVDHQRTLFVTGVFLGERPGPAPGALDFSEAALGMSFAQLTPQLGQSFFIGDGLTGTGSGAQQRFVIPAGATKLYLGFADAPGFQGNPGAYDDNTGSIALRLTQVR